MPRSRRSSTEDRWSAAWRANMFPAGILIDFPHTAFAERLEATRQALDSGAGVIYEASFLADDTFVAVDVLERVGDSWRLIEVKSTTSVKDEHYPDVAVQIHVLRRCGLPVVRAELMHLNPARRHPDLETSLPAPT